MSADEDLANGELYELLGMDPDDYDAAMAAGRNTVDWRGLPGNCEPRWHSHPALGITGHSHSRTEDARRPHGHRPVVGCDCTPVFFADPRPDDVPGSPDPAHTPVLNPPEYADEDVPTIDAEEASGLSADALCREAAGPYG